MILTAFLGMLLWCPTTSWTKLLKCRPEPDTEEEPLGEGSSQAANAVGVQADESMHDLIPLALHVAEAEGWERSHIQRNVHGAEIESYQRDMHLLQETRNAKTSFESTVTRFAPRPNVQCTSPKVENAGILVWHACSGFHQLQSLGGHTAPTAPTTWAVPCLLPMKMMTEAVDEAGAQRMRKRESLEGVGLKCLELNQNHKHKARPHVTLIW